MGDLKPSGKSCESGDSNESGYSDDSQAAAKLYYIKNTGYEQGGESSRIGIFSQGKEISSPNQGPA